MHSSKCGPSADITRFSLWLTHAKRPLCINNSIRPISWLWPPAWWAKIPYRTILIRPLVFILLTGTLTMPWIFWNAWQETQSKYFFSPRCFSRISNFLISILVEKRWESFCKCVPREIAFPQWVNERIFLHETRLKYPSRTFLGQCGTSSWVKGRTISRCLKQWLKNRIRKRPKKKRILIHRNCLFCKVLNKVTLVDSFVTITTYKDSLYCYFMHAVCLG